MGCGLQAIEGLGVLVALLSLHLLESDDRAGRGLERFDFGRVHVLAHYGSLVLALFAVLLRGLLLLGLFLLHGRCPFFVVTN